MTRTMGTTDFSSHWALTVVWQDQERSSSPTTRLSYFSFCPFITRGWIGRKGGPLAGGRAPIIHCDTNREISTSKLSQVPRQLLTKILCQVFDFTKLPIIIALVLTITANTCTYLTQINKVGSERPNIMCHNLVILSSYF